jgi:hypothetical protein
MVIFPILMLGLMASLSPLTIVVFILLLRTKRAQVNAFGFLVGWGISLAVVFVASYAVGSSRASQHGSGRTAVDVVVLLLGLVLIALAGHQWRHRDDPKDMRPAGGSLRFTQHVGTLSPTGALLLGVAKQPWAITAAAAVVVVNAHANLGLTIIAFACFAVVSTATVGLMYLYNARHPEEAAEGLTRLQGRVLAEGPVVMAVGSLVVGLFLVVEGARGLMGS